MHRESQRQGAVSPRRTHQHRLCGIDREPGGQPAHGEKATDELEQTRSASAPAEAHVLVERRVGRHVPHLVSWFPGPCHAQGCMSRPTDRCGACTSMAVRYPLLGRAHCPTVCPRQHFHLSALHHCHPLTPTSSRCTFFSS